MKLLDTKPGRGVLDWTLEAVGAILLVLMVALPIYYFSQLPETVPIHYTDGKPDGYSDRTWLFVLAAIGWLLYIGLSTLAQHLPEFYNFIGNEQKVAKEQQHALVGMIGLSKVLVAGAFCYLIYQTIQIALGEANGLSHSLLPTLWWITFAITGFFVYRAICLHLRTPHQS